MSLNILTASTEYTVNLNIAACLTLSLLGLEKRVTGAHCRWRLLVTSAYRRFNLQSIKVGKAMMITSGKVL
ncbi:hypothetical protein [Vibrio neptunius]|uniref:hypothetical protein n=1 Tax=Vibrio neptunius TaxID=170651 RepID=UPI000A5FDBA8|nr:hypothetical protein [Vibrio neptunius]